MNRKLPATGFTLIELLIVIAIIAVLSVIGAVIYGGVQKGARDARRISDIGAIANAMEAQYGKPTAGQYPALAGGFLSSGVIPVDPLGAASTVCNGANACTYRTCQGAAAITAAACAASATVVAAGSPGGGSTNVYWGVCALLEQAANGSTYFCRMNQQ